MKKYIVTLCMALSFGINSCNVLEIEPVSEILAENFYQSAGGAEAALMHAYNFFRAPLAQNYIVVPGIQSDECFPTRGGNFTRNHSFDTTEIQGNVQDTWRELYGTVQSCNDILENVPNVEDPTINKDQILGEAYFIRGFAYFYLTRFWGKVPLVVEPSKSANQDFLLPRSEVEVVMAQVIEDLLEAESLLSDNAPNRSRASKAAARTLLAKVYLYRNDPGDRERALEKIDDVLADGQFALVEASEYGNIFQLGAQNSRESIFEFSYRPSTAQANHALDQEFVPFPNNNPPRVLPSEKIVQRFLENPEDIRFSVALGELDGTYYVKKYEMNDVNEAARGTQVVNVVMLRLADVILMKAEILNELGRPDEALTYLNQIRSRAGLSPSSAIGQQEIRLAIEDERFLELSFEGHRWWDLIRTGRAMDLSAPRLTNPDRILWPVPGRDIDLNPNLLPQNPSY
jgi:tetratricopeptide (TPR) repeat protein